MRILVAFTALSLMLLGVVPTAGAQVQVAGKSQPAEAIEPAAVVKSLTSQLRNLVSAEESYYADHSTYSNSLKELGYVAREGAVVMVFRADKRGWAGRAVHPAIAGKSCVIWVGPTGEAAQVRTDATGITGAEGEPVCDAP